MFFIIQIFFFVKPSYEFLDTNILIFNKLQRQLIDSFKRDITFIISNFYFLNKMTSDKLNNNVSMFELPFYIKGFDPISYYTVDELMKNETTKSKDPFDKFIDFHSFKICTINAKQVSRYFELSFGFVEIAYKGLETNSRLISSHVLKMNNILIEIVSPLKEKKSLSFDCPNTEIILKQDFEKTLQLHQKKNQKEMTELIFDTIGSNVNLPNLKESINLDDDSKRKLTNFLFNENIFEFHNTFLETCTQKIVDQYNDLVEWNSITNFLDQHGDGVFNISFLVSNIGKIFKKAVKNGAKVIKHVVHLSDKDGSLKLAIIEFPGLNVQHTLIQNINYTGPYLPNYVTTEKNNNAFLSKLPDVNCDSIDHCVENYTFDKIETQSRYYASFFGFLKFWAADKNDIFTDNTSLDSIVMASQNNKIKIPINGPTLSKKKGQIEEFCEFNNGSGIQHIAFKTHDIISTVSSLISRGVEFNPAPKNYYNNLRKRMSNDDVCFRERIDDLERLNILVDYKPESRRKKSKIPNYILQIFTKPLHDRPTFFFEIIQRYHHNGFGKGTFNELFRSIEEQQKLRKTLKTRNFDCQNIGQIS